MSITNRTIIMKSPTIIVAMYHAAADTASMRNIASSTTTTTTIKIAIAGVAVVVVVLVIVIVVIILISNVAIVLVLRIIASVAIGNGCTVLVVVRTTTSMIMAVTFEAHPIRWVRTQRMQVVNDNT